MNQNIRLRNLKRQYFIKVRPHRLTNPHAGTLRDICKDLCKQKQKLCEAHQTNVYQEDVCMFVLLASVALLLYPAKRETMFLRR